LPTHHKGGPAETAVLNAFIKFMRAHNQLSSGLAAHLSGHALTPGQFGVLETLWHLGPLCQHELGEKLLSSKPNISAVVSNLERDGLVRRERDRKDGRSVRVSLTVKGRRAVDKAFPEFVKHITGAMGALNAAELDSLGLLCKKLGLSLDARRRS